MFGPSLNNSTQTQTSTSSDISILKNSQSGVGEILWTPPTVEDGEIGVQSNSPGDLVEMKPSGIRNPFFAVYMGYFGRRHHFYADSGQWIMSLGFSSIFTVAGFASRAEVQPILDALPRDATPEIYDKMQKEDKGPARDLGKPLLERMRRFRDDSERVYQANMEALDNARLSLCGDSETKYINLFEIAALLLPRDFRAPDGFPPWTLYAVHLALSRDVAFRALSPASHFHRKDHIFEISSKKQTQLLDRITFIVRQHVLSASKDTALPMSEKTSPKVAPFNAFISEAKKVVQASRSSRSWTRNGILAPSEETTSLPKVRWSAASQDIITFLEWWASYDLFQPDSRWFALGSTILRALDIYPGVVLDQSMAWVFLQEIGVIPPWELPSRYRVRIPGTSITNGGALVRNVDFDVQESLRKDIAADRRVDRGTESIFCIDGLDAFLIDDGISLERTQNPDEYWIHVHAADPSSQIIPKSPLAKSIEVLPENVYLQGHFQAMIPTEGLGSQFSLKSGSPALTFSAKVNEAGDIIDYKVEASTLRNIIYLEPEDVAVLCEVPKPPPASSHEIVTGIPPETTEPPEPGRPMSKAAELSEEDRSDLLTIHRLAAAIKEKRLARGAWPYFSPKPSVSIAFKDLPKNADELSSEKVLPPDPYIRVRNESKHDCPVVGNTMVLAGEIAARWCADRGMPIPYRRDVKSAQNSDVALKLVNEVIYPQIMEGIEPPMYQRTLLNSLTGGIIMSTEPGPYFIMGLDMYTKATSPLRRFSDLLTHWQIHAALAYEHEKGRRIDLENDGKGVLPFSGKEMEDTIALLRLRERMIRVYSNGAHDWMLIALVRAWQFDKTTPSTFRFTASARWGPGVLGSLDFFGLDAGMDASGLNGLVLLKDIQTGDQFDVELQHVNVHNREIRVQALRYHPAPRAALGEAASTPQ